jgi:hypothetical protein
MRNAEVRIHGDTDLDHPTGEEISGQSDEHEATRCILTVIAYDVLVAADEDVQNTKPKQGQGGQRGLGRNR